MYFIDTHCHLHDPEFFDASEQQKILSSCAKNHVEKLVCIGTSHADSLKAQAFASQHKNVFWSYGIHPSDLEREPKERVALDTIFCRRRVSAQTKNCVEGQDPLRSNNSTTVDETPKAPVAIGEVGLEYHYYEDNHKEQIALFEEMLNLALEYDLPLIFHIREAFDDFFPIIDNFENTFRAQNKTLKGVVHSFSDNKRNLKKCLDRDFYIGVNGMATYSTLPTPPLECTLLETDAPFLAPVPHRGEKNSSSYIPDVARFLAEKHQVPLETVAKITTENAEKLFNI